jgi:hypothetical protein
VQSLWKAGWRFLTKLKIKLPYYLSIPLLGIYPKECKPKYNRATCTPMFIATLITTAKFLKQLRCPATDEWIKKTWHTYKGFFSSIKKNEIILAPLDHACNPSYSGGRDQEDHGSKSAPGK